MCAGRPYIFDFRPYISNTDNIFKDRLLSNMAGHSGRCSTRGAFDKERFFKHMHPFPPDQLIVAIIRAPFREI